MISKNNGYSYIFFGLFLILIANYSLLSDQTTINWDALDSVWPFLRWYGSALHQNVFPDFFPNIFSGFPIGAEILVGPYNIFYLTISYIYPNSVLSLNVIYLLTQIGIFLVGFFIGKTYEFDNICNFYLGLSLAASGYIIGHASHFSHIQAALGLAGIFLAIRLAATDRALVSFFLALIFTYHLCTAGYIQDTVFASQCLIPYFLYLFIKDKSARKNLLYFGSGALIGFLISTPAIWHFYSLFKLSARFNGENISGALRGSMPLYSVLNYLWPYWGMQLSEPTMERFHLLLLSGPLTLIGIFYSIKYKKYRSKIFTFTFIAILVTILALGNNTPFHAREWLANYIYIYRTGRYPSAEHRGVALFLLALISTFGLNYLVGNWRKLIPIILIFTSLDFVMLKNHLAFVQYSKVGEKITKPIPNFQAIFRAEDQKFIDKARNCSPNEANHATAISIERNKLAPNNFYWYGYESMVNKRYEEERFLYSKIICGPSRLWDAQKLEPETYALDLYSPGKIKFTVLGNNQKEKNYIWADVNDEFWELKINNTITAMGNGPAYLRQFTARSGDQIEMTYKGPLSRLWR